MKDEQAAFIADALLALCERSPERPYYTEFAMRGKLARADKREPLYGHLLLGRRDDALLRSECAAVFEIARLTTRQQEVLWMRLEGWTFEEIGTKRGHSKQGAQHIFVQALKKLARSFRTYPYQGLSEVYRRETKRGSSSRGFGTIPAPAR